MILLDSLFPVFFLLLAGKLLRHFKVTSQEFSTTSDRLVYYFFFPLLLFWKIGGSSTPSTLDLSYCLAALITLIIMFFLSTLAIIFLRISSHKAGSFSQSTYRFNTYIGMAIILTALGEEGVKFFGILISFAIPLINLFAISILIWFSQEKGTLSKRLRLGLRAVLVNPLILGCLAGILFSHGRGVFPPFLDNTLRLISMLTLPLALLSIGGALTMSGLKTNLRLSFWAAGFKLMLMPSIGYLLLRLYSVEGIPFQVSMIFFTLPASTAIYVLSAQMNSDTELASSGILISTLLSIISLSIALLL